VIFDYRFLTFSQAIIVSMDRLPNELRIDVAEEEKVKRKAVKRRRICPS
jgi:hypothetical protein